MDAAVKAPRSRLLGLNRNGAATFASCRTCHPEPMTRPEIERGLQTIAEEIGIAERWLVVAKGAAAEGWRARLALLEEEKRVLEGCLAGPSDAEALARSS